MLRICTSWYLFYLSFIDFNTLDAVFISYGLNPEHLNFPLASVVCVLWCNDLRRCPMSRELDQRGSGVESDFPSQSSFGRSAVSHWLLLACVIFWRSISVIFTKRARLNLLFLSMWCSVFSVEARADCDIVSDFLILMEVILFGLCTHR